MKTQVKVLWAVQKYVINDVDGEEMPAAIDRAEQAHVILDVPPFQYNHVKIPEHNGPVIPYGGTKMIESIMGKDGWTCWFNDNFRYHIEMEKFGNRMFNGDGKHMRMKDFSPSMWKDHEYIFVRPDKDTKEFVGETMRVDQFMDWYGRIRQLTEADRWTVTEDTEIIVAPASRIDEEWRIFIVNNCIIDGSQYKKKDRIYLDPDVPEKVFDYVRESIAIWQPSPIFVMDICRVSNDLHILEVGGFHSAGWYKVDKTKVIRAISEYALETYKEKK